MFGDGSVYSLRLERTRSGDAKAHGSFCFGGRWSASSTARGRRGSSPPSSFLRSRARPRTSDRTRFCLLPDFDRPRDRIPLRNGADAASPSRIVRRLATSGATILSRRGTREVAQLHHVFSRQPETKMRFLTPSAHSPGSGLQFEPNMSF